MQLLSYAQLFALKEQESEIWAAKKRATIVSLQKNDAAIQIREHQTGISAKEQESDIYAKIKYLLQVIYTANQQVIGKLNQEKEMLETEKAQLEKGNKLSGYIYQQKSSVSFKAVLPKNNFVPSRQQQEQVSSNYGRHGLYQKTAVFKKREEVI